MQTFHGKRIDLQRMTVADVCAGDVAHSLAHTCRFAGHTPALYSVAQHSLNVAAIVAKKAPQFELIALVHDAHEAYVGDVIRPVKEMVPGFGALESRIEKIVRRALTGTDWPSLPAEVKAADDAMMHTELRLLFGMSNEETPLAVVGARIDVWSMAWARSKWLKRFETLTAG